MSCPEGCDHFDGSRSYEGKWGSRSRRFCSASRLPTTRERELDEIAHLDPGRDFVLHGGPGLPTLVFEL